jgi:hypothetical protein
MPFQYNDYKTFLKDRIASANARGMVSKFAAAAGCQSSYLSKALHEHIHLIPDHLFGIAQYLNLNQDETNFLLLLLEKSRAGSIKYRKNIEEKIITIRKQRENIALLLKKPVSEIGLKESIYYSSWFWSAIHIATSIPELQTEEKIALRFQIPIQQVMAVLLQLEEFGFVRKIGTKWIYSSHELYVPKDSPFVSLHHNHWRQRAILY